MRMHSSGRHVAPLLVGLCLCAGPALSDPAVGIGLTYSFGGGQSSTGIGLRVFADDDRDQATLTIGADYLIEARTFRPTIGAAYVGDDLYFGIDVGSRLGGGGLDFGVGVGLIDAASPAAAPPPEPPDQTPG
jgi:hypothetical protein